MANIQIKDLTERTAAVGTDQVAVDTAGNVTYKVQLSNLGKGVSPDGWTPVSDTWTYASASTITVPSGAASLYKVGDYIKWTQTSVRYGVISAVADTLLTIIVNTDYTVANAAISAIYYSHQANPIGFPAYFNYTNTRTVTLGTEPTYTSHDKAVYWTSGRTIHIAWSAYNASGGTAGAGANAIKYTLPVSGVFLDTAYGEQEVLGTGMAYESGGIDVVTYIAPTTANKVEMLTGALTVISGNDQSSADRAIGANFCYTF